MSFYNNQKKGDITVEQNHTIGNYRILASNHKIFKVSEKESGREGYAYQSQNPMNYNKTPCAIPKILDSFKENEVFFLIQEPLLGCNLHKIVQTYGPLSIDLAILWVKELCQDLSFLQKINDREEYSIITAENTLLLDNGRMVFAEAYDFQNGKVGDLLESIISIGKWLNYLLCSHQETFPIRTIDPTFSHMLQQIIDQCIEGRFSTYEELVQALDSYASIDHIIYANDRSLRPKRFSRPMKRADLSELKVEAYDYFDCLLSEKKNKEFHVESVNEEQLFTFSLPLYQTSQNNSLENDLSEDTSSHPEQLKVPIKQKERPKTQEKKEKENPADVSKSEKEEEKEEQLSEILKEKEDIIEESVRKKHSDPSKMKSRHRTKGKILKSEEPIRSVPADGSREVKQDFRIWKIMIPVMLSLFVVVVGIQVFHFYRNEEYENALQISARSTDLKEQVKECKRAIDLSPDRVEAYEQLLNVYTSDAVFSVEEEKEFLSQIHENWGKVKKNKDYGELAYQVGRTYWYYYNYGTDQDNEITRMKSAVQWFEDSLKYEDTKKYHNIARIYCEIGKFNKNVILSVETGEDAGLYRNYFKNLSELMKIEKANDITKLELYKLIVSSLTTYRNNFIAEGVEAWKIDQIRSQALEEAKKISPATKKAKILKNEILLQ